MTTENARRLTNKLEALKASDKAWIKENWPVLLPSLFAQDGTELQIDGQMLYHDKIWITLKIKDTPAAFSPE